MIGAGIVQFMVQLIVPKFEEIVEDFGMPQPAPMLLLAELANSSWVLLLSLFLLSALFLLLVLAVLHSLGLVRWSFAPFSRLRRRVDSALILRSLASMAEAQKPFGPLLEALASGFPSAWTRRRLDIAARQVAIGSDWCVALQSHGLIGAADAAVIRAGERVGNLPWVLRELATSGERRFLYRLSALGQVLLPLAIVLCGLLVLVVVVVCFQPLVDLIGNLT
jgi:type II secretory pathway component PulF